VNAAAPPPSPHRVEPPRRGFPRAWHVAVLIAIGLGAAIASGLLLGERPDWGEPGRAPRTQGFAFIEIDSTTERPLPIRFDPCSEVWYVVNTEGAPPGAIADLRRSIQLVTQATGLSLLYEGTTDEVPGFGRHPYQPERYGERWAPLLIGWVDGMTKGLSHGDLGIGKAAIRENERGDRAIVSGWVMLNADADLAPGFGNGATWGEVLMHELAHVLGLAHVDDPGQIMYPEVTLGPARWGSGDREGLRWVGSWGRCREVPPPGGKP
jgi:matrixin